jgi:hypothetical protein
LHPQLGKDTLDGHAGQNPAQRRTPAIGDISDDGLGDGVRGMPEPGGRAVEEIQRVLESLVSCDSESSLDWTP